MRISSMLGLIYALSAFSSIYCTFAESYLPDTDLNPISKPQGFPDAWGHPSATFLDGKCGLTVVSNMARFYGKEISPTSIDKSEYRSWGPGLRRDKCAENLNKLVLKDFESKNIENGKSLETLLDHIGQKKPVAIMYMIDSVNAHWVLAVGATGSSTNPEILVYSWGNYYKVAWSKLDNAWKRGYGGPYPYVVGKESTNFSLQVPN